MTFVNTAYRAPGGRLLNGASPLGRDCVVAIMADQGAGVGLWDYAQQIPCGPVPVGTYNYKALQHAWTPVDHTWPWPWPSWAINTYPGSATANAIMEWRNLRTPFAQVGPGSAAGRGYTYAAVFQPANTTSGVTYIGDTNAAPVGTYYVNEPAAHDLYSTWRNASGGGVNVQVTFPSSGPIPWLVCLVTIGVATGAVWYGNWTPGNAATSPVATPIVMATAPTVNPYQSWSPAFVTLSLVSAYSVTNNGPVNWMQGNLWGYFIWNQPLGLDRVQMFFRDPLSMFMVPSRPIRYTARRALGRMAR